MNLSTATNSKPALYLLCASDVLFAVYWVTVAAYGNQFDPTELAGATVNRSEQVKAGAQSFSAFFGFWCLIIGAGMVLLGGKLQRKMRIRLAEGAAAIIALNVLLGMLLKA